LLFQELAEQVNHRDALLYCPVFDRPMQAFRQIEGEALHFLPVAFLPLAFSP